jgi:hypothetical protein
MEQGGRGDEERSQGWGYEGKGRGEGGENVRV